MFVYVVFHKFSNYELTFPAVPRLMFILPAIWSRQSSTWGSRQAPEFEGVKEGAGNRVQLLSYSLRLAPPRGCLEKVRDQECLRKALVLPALSETHVLLLAEA